MTPAVAYARKSVETKDRHSPSIKSQIAACRRAAEAEGLEIVAELTDEGISGNTDKRPGLWRAIRECPRGGIFLTWATDRFSRNIRQAHTFLEDELDPRGIALVAVDDEVDTRTDRGRERFADRVHDAAKERLKTARRVRRWYQQDMLEEGRSHGRPPYGFRKVAPGVIEEDPDTAPTVRMMFQRAAQGWGPTRIIGELERLGILPPVAKPDPKVPGSHRWRVPIVRDLLTNIQYIGFVGRRIRRAKPTSWRDLWAIHDGNHEGIIDTGIFKQAQGHILARAGARAQAPNGFPFLLSGILRCQHCGGGMRTSYQYRKTKRYPRYLCERRYGRGIGCDRGQCIGAERTEHLFVQACAIVARDGAADSQHILYQAVDDVDEERRALEGQRDALQRREQNLLRSIEQAEEVTAELMAEIQKRHAAIAGEREGIEASIAGLERTEPADPEDVRRIFADLPKMLRSVKVTIEEKRAFLRRHFVAVSCRTSGRGGRKTKDENAVSFILRRSALC